MAYHKILVEAQVAPSKYFFTRKRLKQSTLPEHNHYNIEGLSSFVFAKRKASGQVGLARGKSHEHQCYIEALEVAVNSPIDLVFVSLRYLLLVALLCLGTWLSLKN